MPIDGPSCHPSEAFGWTSLRDEDIATEFRCWDANLYEKEETVFHLCCVIIKVAVRNKSLDGESYLGAGLRMMSLH